LDPRPHLGGGDQEGEGQEKEDSVKSAILLKASVVKRIRPARKRLAAAKPVGTSLSKAGRGLDGDNLTIYKAYLVALSAASQ
jgi:hypothetical protein